MKIVIFAGGSGTRFWPLSRKKLPKQFLPIINNQSTLEIQIKRMSEWYGWDNIFISTTESLASLVKTTFPKLSLNQIITEPTKRDLGPAVGLTMIKLQKMDAGNEPVTILWSDSVIGNETNFKLALSTAEKYIKEDPNKLMFLGEKPKYPNENIGWIEKGKEIRKVNGIKIFKKKSFNYRPNLLDAQKWFKEDTHLWNPGYFVTTADFIINQYQNLMPKMYTQLQKIKEKLDTKDETKYVANIYPKLESISFDDAILHKMDNNLSLVLAGEYDWADPGTLSALKEFLQSKSSANVLEGLTKSLNTKDSLIYNKVKNQLVATIGLEGFIVVNTKDALLICHKNQIPLIKKLLESFDNSKYEKFL